MSQIFDRNIRILIIIKSYVNEPQDNTMLKIIDE